ncbi:hypothetical protein D3C81_1529250 [compost metagenome]
MLMTFNTSSVAYFSSKVAVAPRYRCGRSQQLSAAEWCRGVAIRVLSPSSMSVSIISFSEFQKRFEWLSSTPFERPVVPPVYRITAGSCSLRASAA